MKKIVTLFTIIFYTSNLNASSLGSGEFKLTDRGVEWFIYYIKSPGGDKFPKGRGMKISFTIDGNKANMVMSVFKMDYSQVKSLKINKKSKFDKPEKKVRHYNIEKLKEKDLNKEIEIHSMKVKTYNSVVDKQSLEGIIAASIFECKIKWLGK